MTHHTNHLIIGQGLAGTTLAWRLTERGQSFVLVDRSEPATASRVAAGLVTPWTGRRMTRSKDYELNWSEALGFYRATEDRLGQRLFTEQSMVRLFVHRSDEVAFRQRAAESESAHLQPWSGQLQSDGPILEGCQMQPAGRLDVQTYLRASVDFFSERSQWYQFDLSLPDGLVIETNRVLVPELDLSADRVIFCQGAADNPWFDGIPNNVSRGDIINVDIAGYQMSEVVYHSVWLAPEVDGSVTVGSTYDWNFIENAPTAAGRRQILKALGRFVEGPVRVNRHSGAVRPTMKDYRPVIGRHADHHQLWILNGLGSHGVLLVPRLTRLLADLLTDERADPPEEISAGRLRRKPERRSLTEIAQTRMNEVIRRGDVTIDATVGNGFDTCFLAHLVGDTGSVYGFDVQRSAIESTRRRLEAAGRSNVELIHGSHCGIRQCVTVPVRGAMFNLGYLPRSDHSIVTRADTTIEALEQTVERLVDGGIITILAYRGHAGGTEEAQAVECWLQEQGDCTVERIDSRPANATSPVLFVLVRKPGSSPGIQARP